MRTIPRGALVLVLLTGLGAPSRADITSISAPLTLSYEGDIAYNNFEISFVGRGDIVSGTLTGTGPETSTIAYDANFPSGTSPTTLRLTDVITNNSGQAWTGLQFHLSSTAGTFFNDQAVPTIDSVMNPTGPNPEVTALVKYNNGSNGGVIVLSADLQTLTFNTPIADGATIAFQTSPTGLLLGGGSLDLTLTPLGVTAAVPEPSSFVIAVVSGTIGLIYHRRRRAARS